MASLIEDSIPYANLNEFSKSLYSIWKKDENQSTFSEEDQTNAKCSKKAKINDD
jgi:hypothetical protein